MACSGVSPRSTSRYSAKASLTITHSAGSTKAVAASMISRVLSPASTAKVGHCSTLAASRLRRLGRRPWLRASRNRISAALYSG
ncbi:hypothetical protein D3C85_1368560 [compost metagenome]